MQQATVSSAHSVERQQQRKQRPIQKQRTEIPIHIINNHHHHHHHHYNSADTIENAECVSGDPGLQRQ
jgi:hypothetical protein